MMIFFFFFSAKKSGEDGRVLILFYKSLPVKLPLRLIIGLSIGCLYHLWDHLAGAYRLSAARSQGSRYVFFFADEGIAGKNEGAERTARSLKGGADTTR